MAVLKKPSNLPSWTHNSFTNNNFSMASPFDTNIYTAKFPMCICDDTFESYISTAFFKINTDGSSHTAQTCCCVYVNHTGTVPSPAKNTLKF